MKSLNLSMLEYPHYAVSVSPDSHIGNLIFIGKSEKLTFGKEYTIKTATKFISSGVCVSCFITNGNDDIIVDVDLNHFVDCSGFRELKIKEILV